MVGALVSSSVCRLTEGAPGPRVANLDGRSSSIVATPGVPGGSPKDLLPSLDPKSGVECEHEPVVGFSTTSEGKVETIHNGPGLTGRVPQDVMHAKEKTRKALRSGGHLRILVQKSHPVIPDLDLYRSVKPQVVTSPLSKGFMDLLQGEPAGDTYTRMVSVANGHFYAVPLRAMERFFLSQKNITHIRCHHPEVAEEAIDLMKVILQCMAKTPT